MAATTAQIRAWAREHGIGVSDKGKVSEAVRGAYNAAHNGHDDTEPDYPPGMGEDDFDIAEADAPDDEPDDYLAETPPRTPPKVSSARSMLGRLSGQSRTGSKPGKKKGTGKRSSTAEIWGMTWRISAKLIPLMPMQRVLSLQSVIVGPLIDQQVAGTFIDPMLQVIARHVEAGETIGALAGPPLGIGTAMAYQIQCAQQGVEPNGAVLQICAEVTRRGLKSMMKLGGDAFAARLAEEKEDEERYGASVDAVLAWIMSPPEDAATEEQNTARMANIFAGADPEAA